MDNWNIYFEELKKFKNKHGHMKLPRDYMVTVDGKERKLYSWTNAQRSCYVKGLMKKEREKKLKSIGFDFAPHSHRWDDKFEKVKKDPHTEESRCWLSENKKNYKKGLVSKEREEKLRGAFPDLLKTDKEKWLEICEAVKKGKRGMMYGRNLDSWVKTHQKELAEGTLPKWKVKALSKARVFPEPPVMNLFYDVFGTETPTDRQVKMLYAAKKKLSDREKKLLYLRYDKGKSLRECGKIFDITGEMVRQICNRTVKKLKVSVKAYPPGSIENLGLSTRACNSLKKAGVNSVSELEESIKKRPDKLKCAIGDSAYRELVNKTEFDFIEILGLSQNACSRLHRGNIATVSALEKYLEKDPHLKNVKGLGDKTRRETIEKLGIKSAGIEFSIRARNCLEKENITEKELVDIIREDPGRLLEIKGLGLKTYNEIIKKIGGIYGTCNHAAGIF